MAEYIDREALLKNFCGFDLTECAKYGNKTKEQAARSYGTLMMYEIADVIEDAPAADVAPVVHGTPVLRYRPERHEWYEATGLNMSGEPLYVKRVRIDEKSWAMYCPACGKRLCSRFNNYCPHCGAKMDGGSTE